MPRKSGGQQRSIASFFTSPSPSQAQGKKKSVLHIGSPPPSEECKRKSSNEDESPIKRCKGEQQPSENVVKENVGTGIVAEKHSAYDQVKNVENGVPVVVDDGKKIDGSDEEDQPKRKIVRKKRHRVVDSSDEGSGDDAEKKQEEVDAGVQPRLTQRRRLRKVVDTQDEENLKVKADVTSTETIENIPETIKNIPANNQRPGKSIVLEQDELSDKTPDTKLLKPVDDQQVLTGEALERFGGRAATKFWFLGKDRKDGAGLRHGNPLFNPRTLFLPAEFVKGLSGGQKQWWEFKSRHMDKVLLFKVGKFYEMYEMDAHVGVQDLDLQYMKGDQPHCGFPEKNYAENAQRLARKGHRVLVVEQTETPEQLDIRKKKTGAKDKVVRREICAVVTKGTMVDAEMVGDNAETAYILAAAEKQESDGGCTLGLCVVDTSRALFMLGQVLDDAARTKLKSILAELRPVELIKPKGELSEVTEKALHSQSRKPLVNSLIPSKEFWTAEKTAEEIRTMYADGEVPNVLKGFLGLGEAEPAVSAFGGCASYLRQALLDQQLLKFGRIEVLPGSDVLTDVASSGPKSAQEMYMVLDSSALENLEILENNSNGGVSGTLFSLIDHCVTPFGRRLLKQWIVRPLASVDSIIERQVAVEDLQGIAATAVSAFRKELAGLPDVERLVARLSASSGANGRDGENVVLYEDAAKRKTKELLSALRGFQKMVRAVETFESCVHELTSQRLRLLVSPGGECFPDIYSLLKYFENAFDWTEAEKSGQIKLKECAEEAPSGISDVEAKLDRYLGKQRKLFKNDEICYVTVGKDNYLVEIPEQLHSKVPSEYELRSSRKGYRRYWTPELKDLIQQLSSFEGQKDLASKNVLQTLAKRFCKDQELWLSAVHAVSELDALMSLSAASLHMDGKVCKPTFRSSGAPMFEAKALRHPIMAVGAAAGSPFVPNDVTLGGTDSPSFMLLTGPNMGGKSTLLRQVCLAIILAQIGAKVSAEKLELSPVDRLFVRMGAKDHIMSGQSTFLVELLETASMLRCATGASFVALDELGRGTATADGQAIAHAVLRHLAHTTQCRGLFSTHYHRLANDHAEDPRIALQHMACKVGVDADGLDAVTFLYKLTAGPCPKSYGGNVARLAGMPESVLLRADSQSKQLEVEDQQRAAEALTNKQMKLVNDILKSSGSDIVLWRKAKDLVLHVLQ